MPVDLQQFTERLVQSGLFTAEQLSAFQASLPPDKRPASAQDLARELILAERLTRFQAEAVYRGHTKGLVMGEYVVLDRIGAGGMGEVLKARHRRMDRVVALKVLPAKAMKSEEAVRRFYREVKAAARLEHPNIVTAYDAGECEGIHFLVMQYVDGEDLARIVKRRGPMSVDAAVECIVQAARGLEFAHHHGVIHRDIKPGNLLLDRAGTVKVLDMGLARVEEDLAAAADGAERLTSTGQIMGTVDYIAPEQAEDTHAADHRADIYSLGCTLHRLLTGRPPYGGETPIQVVMAHIQKPIPSLREARPDVPEALDAVYQKMLAKRPLDRYQSMGEVIEALAACRAPDTAGGKLAAEAPSDHALSSFLDQLAHGGATTGTKQQAATKTEETQPSVPGPEQETGKRLKAARLAAAIAHPKLSPEARRNLIRYVAIGGGTAVSLVLLGLLIAVLRSGGDKPSPLPSAKEGPGVRALPGRGQPPPLAIAPFSAAQAKKHQQAWADYLGLPVEWTNSLGMTFVLVPPGEFMMGSTEAEREQAFEEAKAANLTNLRTRIQSEGPQHRVKISRPFYLGKYQVTQAQWQAVMGDNPSQFKDPANPVETVSWDDIQPFLAKLNVAGTLRVPSAKVAGTRRVPSAKTGRAATKMKYALPTEAQWEYACRGGTTTAFCFGDDAAMLGQYGWFSNAGGKTHPVGGLRANAWGLYDVHGNVWEWCADWWAGHYGHSPPTDPTGSVSGSSRVQRGGGSGDPPTQCRSATRCGDAPDHRWSNIGFRLACEIPSPPAGSVTVGPPVKVEPVRIQIKPEPLPWKRGDPLGSQVLVAKPAAIPGVISWAIATRHRCGDVCSVAYSPDGRLLATAGLDGAIRLWDPATGELVRALLGQDIEARAVGWSPHGDYLVSADRYHTRIWDVKTGRLLRSLRGPQSGAVSVAWSPDGRTILTGDFNGGSHLWDAESGELLGTVEGQGRYVYGLAWSPDGRMFASGGSDKVVKLCDAETHAVRRTLTSAGAIWGLAWSPDGRIVAAASVDASSDSRSGLQMWYAETGQPLDTLPETHGSCCCLAWSPDGKTLAAGIADRMCWYDVAGAKLLGSVKCVNPGTFTSVAFAPSGETLAWGAQGGTVRLYSLPLERETRVIPGHVSSHLDPAFSPHGKTLVYGNPGWGRSLAMSLRLWKTGSPDAPRQLGSTTSFGYAMPSWSGDGRLVAIVWPGGGAAYVWNVESGKQVAKFPVFPSDTWAALSPDGKILATKGKDVALWDVPSGNLLRKCRVQGIGSVSFTPCSRALSWSPDGKSLAAGTDKGVAICNPETGAVLQTLVGSQSPVSLVAWAPDGKTLAATGYVDTNLYVWDVHSGRLLHTLSALNSRAAILHWLHDGNTLICGWDKRVQMWNAESGKLLCTIEGGGSTISPDGRLLAGQYEGAIRLRRASDGQPLQTLVSLENDQYAILSPEGHYSGSPGVEKELVYVVLTDSGEQLTLTPEEFSKKYGWKNDPAKVTTKAESAK